MNDIQKLFQTPTEEFILSIIDRYQDTLLHPIISTLTRYINDKPIQDLKSLFEIHLV